MSSDRSTAQYHIRALKLDGESIPIAGGILTDQGREWKATVSVSGMLPASVLNRAEAVIEATLEPAGRVATGRVIVEHAIRGDRWGVSVDLTMVGSDELAYA